MAPTLQYVPQLLFSSKYVKNMPSVFISDQIKGAVGHINDASFSAKIHIFFQMLSEVFH